MSVPETMKAIEISRPGGPEVLSLTERPVPKPGPGEVLIRVAAAGVNRPDVLQRMGMYPPPPGASDIPGLEVSGLVIEAGEGAEQAIGGAVCALVAGGGYAEYCVAPAGSCLPVPEVLRLTEAAAMPETLFTVWVNLFERGFAADGDTVLIHGGTSGIGTMAIKLASLFGIQAIVTCGSEKKVDAALKMGAVHAINYNAQDFVAEVREFTHGRGVAVILDMVGGDYVARNLACLSDDGRHVSIAFQRGATAEVPIADIMHSEWGRIDADTAQRLNAARAAGGRLIAVGTTSLRLLESAADDDGIIRPFQGDTAIFITPGYRFRAVDGLVTNFHLPKSTLFMSPWIWPTANPERLRLV